jgi:hypothetical protein
MPLELRRSQESLSLEAMLARYGRAPQPACRCEDCELHRAVQLSQALRKKFGLDLCLPGELNER